MKDKKYKPSILYMYMYRMFPQDPLIFEPKLGKPLLNWQAVSSSERITARHFSFIYCFLLYDI